jgi:23S rRNA (uracil-5-)-methyltransferase RumA
MKRGAVYQGIVEKVDFPNKGKVFIEENGEKTGVTVKNVIPGQKVEFSIKKAKKGRCEGRLLSVLEPSPLETEEKACRHFGECGGCSYQTIPYEKQLEMKADQVKRLLLPVCPKTEEVFEGILGSPRVWEYRNKMEFSFGDEYKDGPLALGLHKRGSMYDVLNADDCRLVHPDYNKVLSCVLAHFTEKNVPYYHKNHEGVLRHLLVRRAVYTGEMLISLITSGQYREYEMGLEELKEKLLSLPLEGSIAGILHIVNDSLADVVKCDEMNVLYGRDYFYDEILGLKFKISTFSFFQTNTKGAEVLYGKAREYIGDTKDQVVFDLYSGTGTIAQLMAPVAKKVIGVEIIPEAVEAAKENAAANGLANCEFIAGDVLQVLDEIEEKPDFIILDPPRDGIHPKALKKICDYQVGRILYISCKPTSLARDLVTLQEEGYEVERVCCVGQFPMTEHVEVVTCLHRVNS